MGKPEERLSDEEVMEHSALAVLEDLLFINKSFLCTQFVRLTDDAPIDAKGILDYASFVQLIKSGKQY